MPGQGAGLGGHPFHQVAVAGTTIGVVIDNRESRPVEPGRQMGLGDGKPNGIGEALPQGPGRVFNPGVATRGGDKAAPLPELLDLASGKS